MNFKPNKAVWTSIGVGVVIAAGAVANTVTIPNTFTAHTPALAAQVNANFLAVKTSIDDNANRIAALESPTCPAGFIKADKWCGEDTPRANATWNNATRTCKAAGMHLCPASLFVEGLLPVYHPNGAGDSEWSRDIVPYGTNGVFLPVRVSYTNDAVHVSRAVVTFSTSDSLIDDVGLPTLPYRCCK